MGNLIEEGNEIVINVDTEKDQIFETIVPINGDDSFTVKIIN